MNEPNARLLITIEDKSFNHKSHNYPKVYTEKIPIAKKAPAKKVVKEAP